MSPRPQVLVVDDQDYVRDSLQALLEHRGLDVRTAGTAEEALAGAAARPVDVVVSDLNLPGADGLELVRRLGREAPGVPVIVLTGHGTVASAVECMKAGAFDYLEKPAEPEALAVAVDRALAWNRMRRELEVLKRGAEPAEGPVGASPAWRRTMELVEAAAATDSTILILGESGAGKDVVARHVHRLSGRAQASYVSVNCGAIPTELFESEFFGHVRGAYTGATADQEGRFRLAHGGTLFLDEVSCLPAIAQAKLLRVLQDGCFERVGDPRPVSVDVRVLAATNADLSAEAEAGRFRKDLLWRLDVVRIELPPLRQRREDIPLLVAHFLPRFARRANKPVEGVTPEALRTLTDYDWPGNVRELQNVLERAVILERGPLITAGSVPLGRRGEDGRGAESPPGNLRDAAARAERQALLAALAASGGVRREAARILGVDPRNLAYYLRKHGLES